jgi:hypothetical protein
VVPACPGQGAANPLLLSSLRKRAGRAKHPCPSRRLPEPFGSLFLPPHHNSWVNSDSGRSIPWIVLASALVVFGVLCKRYVIVLPGLTHPPDLFPGMEIISSTFQEGIVTYSVSFQEVLQALGVLGVIGFLFVLGLKYLELLPTEAMMHEQHRST